MRIGGRDVLVQHDIDPLRNGSNEHINANLDTDAYDLPVNLRVGFSYDVLQDVDRNQLWVSVDAVHPSDNVENVNIGLEYSFSNVLALKMDYAYLVS